MARARLVLAAACAVALSGCATILTGTHQTLRVRSSPAGARVYLDGGEVGATPCEIFLRRGTAQALVIELAGYEPAPVATRMVLNEAALFDLPLFLFGIVPGVIAVAVDVATGALYRVEQEAVDVRLIEAAPRTPRRIYVKTP